MTLNYIVDVEIACVEFYSEDDLSVAPVIYEMTIDLWTSVASLFFFSLLICIS
jgi:hypothetical protein